MHVWNCVYNLNICTLNIFVCMYECLYLAKVYVIWCELRMNLWNCILYVFVFKCICYLSWWSSNRLYISIYVQFDLSELRMFYHVICKFVRQISHIWLNYSGEGVVTLDFWDGISCIYCFRTKKPTILFFCG